MMMLSKVDGAALFEYFIGLFHAKFVTCYSPYLGGGQSVDGLAIKEIGIGNWCFPDGLLFHGRCVT